MNYYRDDVLKLQELEEVTGGTVGNKSVSTPVMSAVSGALSGGIWNSSISFSCA